jgi:hypothetical protein
LKKRLSFGHGSTVIAYSDTGMKKTGLNRKNRRTAIKGASPSFKSGISLNNIGMYTNIIKGGF